MSEVRKHLPYAVYLDTNALRAAGPSLGKQWISELLSMTMRYDIFLCVSELVIREWCEHLRDTLNGARQKLLSSLDLLGEYSVVLPEIRTEDIAIPDSNGLVTIVKKKLEDSGFSIVKDWDGPLQELINEAVLKAPPFEHGGKGFCDAVILESYGTHANESLPGARVLVVSTDSAVMRSHGRFEKRGVSVEFVPDTEIVEKLSSLLDEEEATARAERAARLTEYVTKRSPEILRAVRETPLKITDLMLQGDFLGQERDPINGTVEKILSVRPTGISSVVGGVPLFGKKLAQDRYPVLAFVEIELDVLVTQFFYDSLGQLFETRALVRPNQVSQEAPVSLNRRDNWMPRVDTQTIKRNITVMATIDAKLEQQDIFDGFRIEGVS